MKTLSFVAGRWAAGAAAKDDDFNGQALILRAKRQAMLASNIANADTPGYKATDLNFSAALRRALDNQSAQTSSGEGHVGASAFQLSTASLVQYRQPTQSNLDGNTVDMDLERAEFAQNAILYQVALNALNDELKEFKLASSDPRR